MYLGGRDVESSNCRSDCTLRLHFVRNSPLASLVARGKRGVVGGQRLSGDWSSPHCQEALRALIAGHIGARIGTGTTGPAHTIIQIAMGMERTRATVGTRISRTTAIALTSTSNPIMGMATGNGGSSDRAIGIVGEKPHGPLACSG